MPWAQDSDGCPNCGTTDSQVGKVGFRCLRQLSKDLQPAKAAGTQLPGFRAAGRLWPWGCPEGPSAQVPEKISSLMLYSFCCPHAHFHIYVTPTQPPSPASSQGPQTLQISSEFEVPQPGCCQAIGRFPAWLERAHPMPSARIQPWPGWPREAPPTQEPSPGFLILENLIGTG